MPKHIVRLLVLFAVFGVAAIGARGYFTDKSFGIYGSYRADAVPEIAHAAPIYRGPSYCKTCHTERFTQWSAGVHKVVVCETCHGAAGTHPEDKPPAAADTRTHSLIAAARYDRLAVSIPADTVKLCTLCHEKMPGRPATQPQIEVRSHAGAQECTVCHNPHSPKITVAAVSKTVKPGSVAVGKEKAALCAACHGDDGVSTNPDWPNLAGQQRGYLVSALQGYKAGTRSDPTMTDLAKDLSETDMNALAAYYASLSCKSSGTNAAAPAVSAGNEMAAACAACHGAEGVSANPAWPSLAGLSKAYLVNALKAYQTGARKNPMMARPVKDLNDSDIGRLATYYAGLNCK